MRLVPFLPLLLAYFPAGAQSVWLGAATRSVGGAGIALRSDVPYPLNPASLPDSSTISAGVSRLYGLAEIVPQRLGVSAQRRSIRWAVSATALKLVGYTDARVALSAATSSSSGDVGIRIGMRLARAGPYPAKRGLMVSAGFRYALSREVSAGVVAGRGFGSGSPVDETPLLAIGVAWSNDRLTMPVDLRRSGRHPPSLHTGLVFRAAGPLRLSVGSSTAPDLLSAGFSLHFRRLGVDVGADRHVDLGLSVHLDLRWHTG